MKEKLENTFSRGQFVQEDVEKISQDDLLLINKQAPRPLTEEEVYVRSMYLCSDQICESDWARFTPEALQEICRMVVGASVLSGHNKQTLPIARFLNRQLLPVLDIQILKRGNLFCGFEPGFTG